jgi:hypothetical protein
VKGRSNFQLRKHEGFLPSPAVSPGVAQRGFSRAGGKNDFFAKFSISCASVCVCSESLRFSFPKTDSEELFQHCYRNCFAGLKTLAGLILKPISGAERLFFRFFASAGAKT